MPTTRVSVRVRAPRAVVYRALLDPDAVGRWRVPDGMTAEVHEFDAREGGAFRVSLTYDDGAGAGKSGAATDTYRGRFVRLVLDEVVVEEMSFESADPALRGSMRITTTLTDVEGGTVVTVEHEGAPDAVDPAANEVGTRRALANLAALVEAAAFLGDPAGTGAPAAVRRSASTGYADDRTGRAVLPASRSPMRAVARATGVSPTAPNKLREAGVDVSSVRMAGMVHDFLLLDSLRDTRAANVARTLAIDAVTTALR